MTQLLDDLQTLSMAEAGVLRLHREQIDLGLLIADVASAHRPVVGEASIALIVDARPGTSLDVDPIRIRQVLENVLANGVRHTHAGGNVQVQLAMGERSATIQVRDTGDGIPPDDLPHIFDRFTKSADSGGSGLGLAIARRLVEAHGGTIGAESTPGQGTVVTITLPR
jgi:two-component system sensor histidine kinase BaeS